MSDQPENAEKYPTLSVFGRPVNEPRKDLECFPNPAPGKPFQVKLECNEFTCRCPITGQPDFAIIRVQYVPDQKIVESKSFKLYIWSFRDEQAFHEKVINEIADFFMEKVEPVQVNIQGIFNPRGGVGILVEAMRQKAQTPPAGGLVIPSVRMVQNKGGRKL